MNCEPDDARLHTISSKAKNSDLYRKLGASWKATQTLHWGHNRLRRPVRVSSCGTLGPLSIARWQPAWVGFIPSVQSLIANTPAYPVENVRDIPWHRCWSQAHLERRSKNFRCPPTVTFLWVSGPLRVNASGCQWAPSNCPITTGSDSLMYVITRPEVWRTGPGHRLNVSTGFQAFSIFSQHGKFCLSGCRIATTTPIMIMF